MDELNPSFLQRERQRGEPGALFFVSFWRENSIPACAEPFIPSSGILVAVASSWLPIRTGHSRLRISF